MFSRTVGPTLARDGTVRRRNFDTYPNIRTWTTVISTGAYFASGKYKSKRPQVPVTSDSMAIYWLESRLCLFCFCICRLLMYIFFYNFFLRYFIRVVNLFIDIILVAIYWKDYDLKLRLISSGCDLFINTVKHRIFFISDFELGVVREGGFAIRIYR